jgi:hypothetical protein
LRPYVPIRIIGPSGSRRFSRALVDSGSDDTIFPLVAAKMIGVSSFKQSPGVSQMRIRWRGQSYLVEFADVELELSDAATTLRWPATIGFSSAPIPTPLLGQTGTIEFIDAKIIGADALIELEPNARTFPGQMHP